VQYRKCRVAICNPAMARSFCVQGVAAPEPSPPIDPLQCPYCGRQYKQARSLTRHIAAKHGESDDSTDTSTNIDTDPAAEQAGRRSNLD
jgi:hypothetical protein